MFPADPLNEAKYGGGGNRTRDNCPPKWLALAESEKHWLAGLVDGEGCFFISRINGHKPTPTYICGFAVKMRADDAPLLIGLQESTGLGTITYVAGRGGRRKKQVRWSIYRRSQCLELVDFFEKYPLRSKKARDFGVWARAVRAWDSRTAEDGWDDLARLHQEIRDVRAYEEAAV